MGGQVVLNAMVTCLIKTLQRIIGCVKFYVHTYLYFSVIIKLFYVFKKNGKAC